MNCELNNHKKECGISVGWKPISPCLECFVRVCAISALSSGLLGLLLAGLFAMSVPHTAPELHVPLPIERARSSAAFRRDSHPGRTFCELQPVPPISTPSPGPQAPALHLAKYDGEMLVTQPCLVNKEPYKDRHRQLRQQMSLRYTLHSGIATNRFLCSNDFQKL